MELIIFFWFICGVIAAVIGSDKECGCLGFILGILLGPFGIIIILLIKGNRKLSPYCMSRINAEATVCSKCQRDMPQEEKAEREIESEKTKEFIDQKKRKMSK